MNRQAENHSARKKRKKNSWKERAEIDNERGTWHLKKAVAADGLEIKIGLPWEGTMAQKESSV